MKTKFFLLVALISLLPACATAQFFSIKNVAITEVVSTDPDISESTKIIIRDALKEAITKSEGYKGFVSISFINFEANFDKSGNITSAMLSYTKKQMMDYILVARVTLTGKYTAHISADIIRTSNGELVASDHEPTSADRESLYAACKRLSYRLVRGI